MALSSPSFWVQAPLESSGMAAVTSQSLRTTAQGYQLAKFTPQPAGNSVAPGAAGRPTVAARAASAGMQSPKVAQQQVEKPLLIGGSLEPAWEEEVVDLGGLGMSPEQRAKVVEQVRAGGERGVFYVRNFGVDVQLMDEVRALCKAFFSLSTEEKRQAKQQGAPGYGYVPNFSKYGSPFPAFREFFRTIGYPEALRERNAWPDEQMPELREKIEKFQELMYRSANFVAGLLAEGLGLPPSYLIDQYGQLETIHTYTWTPGLNQVPEAEGGVDLDKVAPGLGTHTDPIYFHFNIAGGDDASFKGLQHFVGGEWRTMPVFRDAALINIGEDLETVSNGRYHASLHRVLRSSTSSQTRLAFVTSVIPHEEAVMAPAAQLVQPQTSPILYRTRRQGDRILEIVKAFQPNAAMPDRSKAHLFFQPELHLDRTRNIYLAGNQELLNGMPLQEWGLTL